VLPAGAGLAPLRWLLLPANPLTASLPILKTAQRLELLGSYVWDRQAEPQLVKVVQWAGERSQLRWLLAFSTGYRGLGTAEQEQIDEVQCQHPHLAVSIVDMYKMLISQAVELVPDLAGLL
jgi:hypothetical protein